MLSVCKQNTIDWLLNINHKACIRVRCHMENLIHLVLDFGFSELKVQTTSARLPG